MEGGGGGWKRSWEGVEGSERIWEGDGRRRGKGWNNGVEKTEESGVEMI